MPAAGLSALVGLVTAWYVVLSGVTFAVYARDKNAARQQRRRTPELTLHCWSLAGGWPGAWLAQRLVRHKSAKPGFLLGYWLTVLANCAVLAAVLIEFALK